MKKTIIFAALFAIFFFGGCARKDAADSTDLPQSQPEKTGQEAPAVSEKYCQNDGDCACGRHVETRECFFGNAKYVDPNLKPCPDFCSGIDGKMKIKCVDNICNQSRD